MSILKMNPWVTTAQKKTSRWPAPQVPEAPTVSVAITDFLLLIDFNSLPMAILTTMIISLIYFMN